MNKFFKKNIVIVLCALMIISLAGCTKSNEKKYQEYVKDLITINYLGATDDYLKSTGANKKDAEELYEENIDVLTDNIIDFYGIKLAGNTEIREQFEDISKEIYEKVNYKVSKPYEEDGSYKLDVTIYPINLFPQVADEVTAYVDGFNERVSKGEFNDYTTDEYQAEFCTGLIEILGNGADNMTYADPVTVTVTIIEEADTFFISDEDFLAIDTAMIATGSTNSTDATNTDAK